MNANSEPRDRRRSESQAPASVVLAGIASVAVDKAVCRMNSPASAVDTT